MNTCLDKMEEFKGRDIAVSCFFFPFLVTELSKEFWLRNSSLSYYRVNTICRNPSKVRC